MKLCFIPAALVLSIATLAGPAAFAQISPAPQPGMHAPMSRPPANPHRTAMKMSRQLGLSPDQTAKLEPILADRQQKVMALRADNTLTDTQRKQQLHAVAKGSRMQMASVLSPDQMHQWNQVRRSEHAARHTPAAGV